MISESRRDKALTFLVETDETCAMAKALMIGLEHQEKTVLSISILSCGGSTAQEREAMARTSDEYQKWRKGYVDSVQDYEILRNRRMTNQMVVECWRSENANRRQAGQL